MHALFTKMANKTASLGFDMIVFAPKGAATEVMFSQRGIGGLKPLTGAIRKPMAKIELEIWEAIREAGWEVTFYGNSLTCFRRVSAFPRAA